MRLPNFQYVEPKSIEDACLFLKDHGQESKIMGGGTDLLPSMKQRVFKPKYLLNLSVLSDLGRVRFDGKSGLQMGPLVRLRTLETDPLILEKYPVIARAAGEIASVQLRRMGTVGGNLSLDTRCYYYNQSDFWRSCRPTCIKMGGETCNAVGGGKRCFAVFSGDLAPVLIALGAEVKLVSAGDERAFPLSDFYTGDGARPLELRADEVLAGIQVPVLPKEAFTHYLKYRIRKSIDFPLAGVATMLMIDPGTKVCREAKVVIGAAGTKPEDVKEIRELFVGRELKESTITEAAELAFKAGRPIANAAGTPSYRKKMIRILVERSLRLGLKGSA